MIGIVKEIMYKMPWRKEIDRDAGSSPGIAQFFLCFNKSQQYHSNFEVCSKLYLNT